MIRTIIENGFRYFTNSVFYLLKSKTMIKFDCHHQVVFYPKNFDDIFNKVKQAITTYGNDNFEVSV